MPNELPTLDNVYAYARFSSRKQSSGDSERRQHENAQNWGKEHGCKITYFVDPGISARHGKNRTVGQFGAFVARLKAGELGENPTLLIENFDRISREDITEALPQFLELLKLGATIVTLHNRMIYRHPIDLTEAILALVEIKAASSYSANLSRRVSASWQTARRNADKGICIHRGITPGWLRQEGTVFLPIPDRVNLIKLVFAKYLAGHGTQKIATWLNQSGIPSWPHKGQRSIGWHATTVRNLLRNQALIGNWQPHKRAHTGKRTPVGIPILGYFPAVIEPEIFRSAQDVFKCVNRRGRPAKSHWNLVAGLAWSGVDGTPMWGQKHSPLRQNKVRHYLKSSGSIAGRTKPPHCLAYTDFEPRLLALLRHLDEDRAPATNGRDEVAEAKNEIIRLTKQVEKYRQLIRDDDEPSPTLISELKQIERELAAAQTAESKARARVLKAIHGSSKTEIDLTSPAGRARLHRNIVQRFEKFVFDRDVVHCWFHVATRQGVDLPLTGPVTFDNSSAVHTAPWKTISNLSCQSCGMKNDIAQLRFSET